MSPALGESLDELESPQLLLDLDTLDTNLTRMQTACRERRVDLRVHFKSLKCGGLALYLSQHGVERFLCAKLNEAEVLVGAGMTDVFVANQIIGPVKLARLAALAKQDEDARVRRRCRERRGDGEGGARRRGDD